MEQQVSSARIALKWGFLTSIIIVIFSTILYLTDLWQSAFAPNIAFLFLGLGIYYALQEYKTQNNGFLSIGNGLGVGSLLSVIVGLFSGIFSYIYNNYVDTQMMQKIIDFQRQKLEEQGIPSEQVEQSIKIMQSFMTPSMTFIFGIIMYLFAGFILSLIIAAIIKKNKPEI